MISPEIKDGINALESRAEFIATAIAAISENPEIASPTTWRGLGICLLEIYLTAKKLRELTDNPA